MNTDIYYVIRADLMNGVIEQLGNHRIETCYNGDDCEDYNNEEVIDVHNKLMKAVEHCPKLVPIERVEELQVRISALEDELDNAQRRFDDIN